MKKNKDIPTCNNCLFARSRVFQKLPLPEIDNIEYDKGVNFYKRNNVIYREGNRISGFYCINSGVIKLFKTGLEGKEQIIRFAKAGDIIGYRSILSGELACTTAQAIEDTVACFIPAGKLTELVSKYPSFAMEIMKLTCKELGESNKYILDIAQKTVRERLAEILLLLTDNFGLDNDKVLQISLTREELANMVGTATESVIRLLSEFKSDKIIELKGRKIRILKINKLSAISNLYIK